MADLLPVRTAHKVTLLNKNETNEGKKKSVNKINRLPNGNFNQDILFLLLFVQASFWSSKSWCLEHTAVESAKAQARVWQSGREWQLLRAHKVALIANPWLCKINYYPSDQNTLFSVTVVGINDNKIKNPSRVTPTPLQALKIELWNLHEACELSIHHFPSERERRQKTGLWRIFN